MSSPRYHLAVVGAGSAGLASAALAAELGARVALIERHCLGGDRLSYRVPAAALVQAARVLRAARRGGDLLARETGHGHPADRALARARRLRDAAAEAAGSESLHGLGVDVFFGAGKFVAADAVEVDGRRLRFHKAMIATGARTAVPRIPGLDQIAYRAPETLCELPARPARFAVLGGGSRGCEMAQTFAIFGSEVHLFDPGERLLRRRDPDAALLVTEAMRRDGVEIHLRSGDLEIRQLQDAVQVILPGGRGKIAADEVLLAAGPMPNVEGLGLEAAGVDYDLAGIRVDRFLRTTNRRIFAAGGVVTPKGGEWGIAPPGLVPDADARMAVRNALLLRRLESRRRTVPRVTYTDPEIARVGIGAGEAAASPARVETLTVALTDADRSGMFGEEGFLRVHLRRRGGRVLGGTLVASGAAELIGPLAMAVRRRLRLGVFAEIPLPHPTRSEIYRRAAFAWRRQKVRRRTRASSDLLGLWLRISSRL